VQDQRLEEIMSRRTLAYLLSQPPPRERSPTPALAFAALLAVGITCNQGTADDGLTPGDAIDVAVFTGPKLQVVLDPGHDPKAGRGGRSVSGRWEVELNDTLAAALGAELDRMPHISWKLSRAPSESLSLQERAEYLETQDPDLVVSLHHDSVHADVIAACNRTGVWDPACGEYEGFSLFVPTRGYFAGVSRMVAERIATELAASGRTPSRYHESDLPGEGRALLDPARGIYAGDFLYLLRTVKRPIVLVEAGFMASNAEETWLTDPENVRDQARRLAAAIDNWATTLEIDRSVNDPPGPAVDDAAIRFPDQPTTGPVVRWQRAEAGLEAAVVPIYFRGELVDRMVLTRAQSEHFRIGVHHSSTSPKTITEWQRELAAPVVINSSFYEMDWQPQTPIVAGGVRKGPAAYVSRHGALVAEPKKRDAPRVAMLDFRRQKVDLSGFGEAVVSYPTLVDFAGKVRAARNPAWRADRSFVALDQSGRVIFGTTEGGFFSLRRLGETLRAMPGLDLSYALNLDGGPPACLAIDTDDLSYVAWGRYESNDSAGREIIFWGDKELEWKLPAVLALERR
jgi:N-acetylmuramoyl-L-alanine amidase